jgi:hypothetical protein
MANKSKAEMLSTLRTLLRQALVLRSEGVPYARLAHANGAVDGYLRALLDSGLATQAELLAVVSAERAAVGGPATKTLSAEPVLLVA